MPALRSGSTCASLPSGSLHGCVHEKTQYGLFATVAYRSQGVVWAESGDQDGRLSRHLGARQAP